MVWIWSVTALTPFGHFEGSGTRFPLESRAFLAQQSSMLTYKYPRSFNPRLTNAFAVFSAVLAVAALHCPWFYSILLLSKVHLETKYWKAHPSIPAKCWSFSQAIIESFFQRPTVLRIDHGWSCIDNSYQGNKEFRDHFDEPGQCVNDSIQEE